jgi:hypothetical protein
MFDDTNIVMKLLILALFSTTCLCASARGQKCLEYGPTVTLTGTLRSHVFPGPPNFESIKRGDLKETALLLALTEAACVIGNGPADQEIAESDIRRMQLVVRSNAHWKIVRRLMGRRAVVTGTLFHWETGHHHTKVLIDVSSIRGSRR